MSAGTPIPNFEFPYTSYTPNGQNGRVNLEPTLSAGGNIIPDSAGFEYAKESEKEFAADMLRGNWEVNALSKAFFTSSNLDIIQNAIRKEVYDRSGSKKYLIDKQDVNELKVIMKAMFLQYAKNSPYNIPEQVNDLNKLVINWSVPRILSEVDHYHYYLKDISHMPTPMAHPMNMSTSGLKTGPVGPFT
jgi:hypothetical protein